MVAISIFVGMLISIFLMFNSSPMYLVTQGDIMCPASCYKETMVWAAVGSFELNS